MQEQKSDSLSNPSAPTFTPQIYEGFKNLNEIIDDLDVKVDIVIEKHEAQFLFAYRNHIKRIKFELKELKDKADEQQKKLTDNDRMYYLEKQISIFREEALKLYDKLEEKSQQAEVLKSKLKQLQKSAVVERLQSKQLLKHTKMLEAKLHLSETKVIELQEQIKEKDQLMNELKNKTENMNTISKKYTIKTSKTPLKTISHSKGIQMKGSRKKINKIYDSQLKDWFLECVKAIKKDVAYRKNTGYQFDFTNIHSIEEFKMVDKLRLLEKFMENEKLLTWMYEKIFPNRTNEVRDYFSHKNLPYSQHVEQKDNSEGLFDDLIDKEKQKEKVEVVLPKMAEPKKHQLIRNKVNIKNGKLNLSSF